MSEMKTWTVSVRRGGATSTLGQVQETSESLARCAALSKYALVPGEGEAEAGIGPDDDFDVTPA